MPKIKDPRLVSITVAAGMLDINPKTLRRRIADGSIAGYRVGPKLLKVNLNELEDLYRPIPTAIQSR